MHTFGNTLHKDASSLVRDMIIALKRKEYETAITLRYTYQAAYYDNPDAATRYNPLEVEHVIAEVESQYLRRVATETKTHDEMIRELNALESTCSRDAHFSAIIGNAYRLRDESYPHLSISHFIVENGTETMLVIELFNSDGEMVSREIYR